LKRNQFIKSGLAAPLLLAMPESSAAIEEFVRAGHNDHSRVRSMLESDPSLINASYDWGNHDFETALDGASHVGNYEIAGYLIEKGANPTIFSLVVMGQDELVMNWLESFPDVLYARGPHGLNLLHHARISKRTDLEKYLIESGLTETKFD